MSRRFDLKRLVTAGMASAAVAAAPAIFSGTAAADTLRGEVKLVQDIQIEPETEVRIIEPEVRIIESEPKIQVEVKTPGHYERQRVMVREGYSESYQVWVPKERYGFLNLKKVPGHFETRTRWIPPTYEYRDVWVPER
ncbi:MAG: hypothetical protein HUU46_22195 [Candidatus Hydrogenedentes bacterium]|nr:hypothetical protein [Candidatus Hydrogenedentota bacterium]